MDVATRYARNGEVSIAYQVIGQGELDLLWVPGFASHVELYQAEPAIRAFQRRLASFARLIVFDKRGTGLSDPVAGVPSLEERMEDMRAVLDAVGSERPALFGISEGGPASALFAATYPERTRALIEYGTIARGRKDAQHPWGLSQDAYDKMNAALESWGEGRSLEAFAPSIQPNTVQRLAWAAFERAAASPAMARAIIRAWTDIDLEPILPLVRVPTLVLHRTGDFLDVEGGRYIAQQIPGARYVELEGCDHLPWIDFEPIADEIEEFLTGAHHAVPERALATVLFTDIVDSTRRAAELGDGPWRDLLDRHDALVRNELHRHDGREVKTTGDGFLTTFDGPAAAIRCARAIVEELRSLGLDTRAGIHTGECELRGDDVAGMAVHIGARIGALAAPGEVLVSGTVRDLVVGSGIEFADHGEHELKGVPGRWRVFAVADHHAPAGQATAGVLQQREPLFAALLRRAPAVSRVVLSATRRRR